MSYISLLKNIPTILTQPTGIAIIASFSIHGAIALIVPLMPVDASNSQADNLTKTVGVVELSPSDQQGLPQDPTQVAVLPQNPLAQQLPPGYPVNGNEQPTTVFTPGMRSLPTREALPTNPQNKSYSVSALPKQLRFDRSFNAKAKGNLFRPSNNFVPPVEPGVTSRTQENNSKPKNSGPTQEPVDNTGFLPSLPFGNTPTSSKTEVDSSRRKNPVIDPTPQSEALEGKSGVDQQSYSNYKQLEASLNRDYPSAKQRKFIREIVSIDKSGKEGSIWGLFTLGSDGKPLNYYFDQSAPPELQQLAKQHFAKNPPKSTKELSYYSFRLHFRNDSNSIVQNDNTSNDQKTVTEENTHSKPSSPNKSGTAIIIPSINQSTPTPSKNNRQSNGVIIPSPDPNVSPESSPKKKELKDTLRNWKKETTQSHQNSEK